MRAKGPAGACGESWRAASSACVSSLSIAAVAGGRRRRLGFDDDLRSPCPRESVLRVAYLTAQYPKTSHSFIRREIAALERLGFRIERYSVRRVDEPLVDPDDIAERERTHVILESGPLGLVARTGLLALRRP